MDCKQIGQYVLVCDNTNWYFDNDNNGMSYFIYKPTDTKYSMVMAPQSCCCGCNNEPNIEFGTNAQIVQSTIDEAEAQEWLNSLVNNNFMGMVAVPTYIKQYEAIRKYINATTSSKFTESDLHHLEENMYKAYNITEQSFINYVNYYSENYEYNAEFENVDHFVEGFKDTAAKILAGKSGRTGFASTGLLAMLPMIINKLSILFPTIKPYTVLFQGALCIAKIWAGIKMAQASPKYLQSDKKGRALLVSTAIASQILQCFAVLRGKRFLTGIVNKLSNIIGSLVTKKETGTVALATAAAAATSAAITDAGVTDANIIEELHNPDVSIEDKVEILKDANVPEEKITKITQAVEKETAAEATLKSEAIEAVNKANQEQMAAAAAEKQQPVENNVNSIEQAPTEVASSQPVENTNNEQVTTVDNQQQDQVTKKNSAYDMHTGAFLSDHTVKLANENYESIADYNNAKREWGSGTEEIFSRNKAARLTGKDVKWEDLTNEEQAKIMQQTSGKNYTIKDVNNVEKIFTLANKDKANYEYLNSFMRGWSQSTLDFYNKNQHVLAAYAKAKENYENGSIHLMQNGISLNPSIIPWTKLSKYNQATILNMTSKQYGINEVVNINNWFQTAIDETNTFDELRAANMS